MKKTILVILTLVTVFILKAQNPQFEWVKSNVDYPGYGGESSAGAFAKDASGNIYILGSFKGIVDFNPSPSAAHWVSSVNYMTTAYIQKLDINGNFVWVKTIYFENGSLGCIEIDDSGNLVIMGSFKDSVDIAPDTMVYKLFSKGDYDVFILKLTSAGNFIWAKSFGGIKDVVVRDMCIDNQGNVYSHGYYKDTVDFDPGPGTCIYGAGYSLYNTPLNNAFIQKLDKNGNFLWTKVFLNSETGGLSRGISIDLDQNRNVYCTGYFEGTGIDFDPGAGLSTPPTNAMGEYIVKLDSLGSFIWAKFTSHVISWGFASPNSIKTDIYNNIYTTGTFKGHADFDPGPDTLLLDGYTSGDRWAFIQKLDENGNLLWAKSYGRANKLEPLSITTDTFGNVYSTGVLYDSADLDPGPDTLVYYTYSNSSLSSMGAYLQKLNPNGDLLWAGVLQGNLGKSVGACLIIDDVGNVYLTGYYDDTVDFNPGSGVYNQTTPNSKNNSYILKLSQCKVYATDYITACDSLLWMDGITYYQSNQSANFTLPSSTGCDSIICLSLNIPVIDTTISFSNHGATFIANQSNASYQWLDCNNDYVPLLGDTLQTFTPTANGNYAVAINVSGCVDTSACMQINNVSIEEIEGNSVKLYPNPNSGKFMLDLGNLQATEVRILNSMGQEILVMQEIKSQYFDMELNPGIYFIQIQTEKVNRTVRFVVR
ncbi:MAG: T9SS type A sorting domain-containing protein [Saprospiraceae bacterium]|nr:T9SS type A sorting domain-containing protein [Saprospiraceae bacterium]